MFYFIPFLKVYIALTAPERTDSQSMLQGEPKLKVYATISIRNGIISELFVNSYALSIKVSDDLHQHRAIVL